MVDEGEQKLLSKKKCRKVTFESPTKERIVEAKKKSMQILQSLLESSVSEELLLSSCNFISQDDYLNIIEERNILLLCGCPLCPKELKLIKQKYHISLKSNKVFDITERKCFCSNTCYKASNFLKAQLCTSPIWLKEKGADEEPIKLLCSTHNSGSVGEEVDLGHSRMTTEDIEWVPEKANKHFSENACSSQISDDLETSISALEKLEISERYTYSINTDSLESTLLNSGEKSQDGGVDVSSGKYDGDSISLISEQDMEKVNSPEQPVIQCSYLDSDDDDDDCDKLLLDHKKYESLISNNKYMPVIPKAKVRKALLIDPIGNPNSVLRLLSATEKMSDSLELIQNTLMTWITVETYHILLGEKIELLKNEILKNAEVSRAELQTNSVDKLKMMKDSYTKICLKLKKEEAIELNCDTTENNLQVNSCHDKVQEEQLSESKGALVQLKVSMFYKGEIGLPETTSLANKKQSRRKPKPTARKIKKKESSGKIPIKMKEMEPVTVSAPREVSVLPIVESLSQNTLRRQIVVHHLKNVYVNILPLIGLHYCDISEDFQLLISSFSLSSKNISFKPSEWKTIAVILFRMIEKKLSTEKIWAQDKCWQLLESKLVSFDISLDHIDALLASVIDHSHFKKLLLGC